MWQGEAKTLDVNEVNDTDISGETIKWILADEVGEDPTITKDNDTSGGITIDTPASGEFEISLDAADTDGISGRFYHEARLVDSESVLFTGEAIIHASGTN